MNGKCLPQTALLSFSFDDDEYDPIITMAGNVWLRKNRFFFGNLTKVGSCSHYLLHFGREIWRGSDLLTFLLMFLCFWLTFIWFLKYLVEREKGRINLNGQRNMLALYWGSGSSTFLRKWRGFFVFEKVLFQYTNFHVLPKKLSYELLSDSTWRILGLIVVN